MQRNANLDRPSRWSSVYRRASWTTGSHHQLVAVWTSFIDLVHLVGAVGCVLLTAAFAAQGEPARAAFYGLTAIALTVGLAYRRDRRPPAPAPAPTSTSTPVVIDLRAPGTTQTLAVTPTATSPTTPTSTGTAVARPAPPR